MSNYSQFIDRATWSESVSYDRVTTRTIPRNVPVWLSNYDLPAVKDLIRSERFGNSDNSDIDNLYCRIRMSRNRFGKFLPDDSLYDPMIGLSHAVGYGVGDLVRLISLRRLNSICRLPRDRWFNEYQSILRSSFSDNDLIVDSLFWGKDLLIKVSFSGIDGSFTSNLFACIAK